MTPASRELNDVMLALKAQDQQLYMKLVGVLGGLKNEAQVKAVQSPPDNSAFIAIGFARGYAEIHRLCSSASVLPPQTNPDGS